MDATSKNHQRQQSDREAEQHSMVCDFWGALVSVTLATERWSGPGASRLDRIALRYVEVAAEQRIRPLAEAVARGEIDLDRVRHAPEIEEREVHALLDGAPKLLESRAMANMIQDVDVALLRDPTFAQRRAGLDRRNEAAE